MASIADLAVLREGCLMTVTASIKPCQALWSGMPVGMQLSSLFQSKLARLMVVLEVRLCMCKPVV